MKRSFFLLTLFCSDIAFAATPNIVFVLANDLAPDVVGAFGHPIVKTPNLDALAIKGFVFTRAVVGYPICYVSRAEILTGRCAFRTGVQYRGKAIEPSHALWPETLRRGGYRTWFSGKWHSDGSPKQRGFETTAGLFSSGGSKGHVPMPDHAGRPATGYTGWTFKADNGEVEIDKGVGLTPDTDRYIVDGAVSLIERNPREPLFLQVSLTGPHDPRIEPRGYEGRYRPQDVSLPSSVQSRSLVPLLKRESTQIYPEVYSCFTDTQRMIRGDRWKLVWYPKLQRYQLFDIIEDPDEHHNKFDDPQHAELLETMRNKLVSWLKQNDDPLFD